MPPRRPRVAVVDSNHDSAEMLAELLLASAVDAQVLHASREALFAEIEAEHPDVVVIDLAPPYASSWADFERLRDAASAGVEFVVITTAKAFVDPLAQGSVDVVSKPFRGEEFVDAVCRSLHRVAKREFIETPHVCEKAS